MRRTLPGLNADLAVAVRRVNAAYHALPEHLRPDLNGSSWAEMEREVDRACGAGDREAALQAISGWGAAGDDGLVPGFPRPRGGGAMNPAAPSPTPEDVRAGIQRTAQASIELTAETVEVIACRVAELLADQAPAGEVDPYLTVEQAADYLACRPKRIYDLCSQRRVAFHKDGSRTLLRRSDLDAYVRGNR